MVLYTLLSSYSHTMANNHESTNARHRAAPRNQAPRARARTPMTAHTARPSRHTEPPQPQQPTRDTRHDTLWLHAPCSSSLYTSRHLSALSSYRWSSVIPDPDPLSPLPLISLHVCHVCSSRLSLHLHCCAGWLLSASRRRRCSEQRDLYSRELAHDDDTGEGSRQREGARLSNCHSCNRRA